MKHIFFSILLCLSLTTLTKAQYFEIGGGIGGSFYIGDLNSPELSTTIGETALMGEAFVRYVRNKNLAFRISGTVGKLQGYDSKSTEEWQRNERNLSFRSLFYELGVRGEYYLFGYDASKGEHLFSPYVIGGLSVFGFNPKTEYQGETVSLQPLGTEGQGIPGYAEKYSRIALAVPFGGGIKMKVNEKYNLGIEAVMRYTFTDYIDDVSTNYPDLNDLLLANGPVAAALTQRGHEVTGIPTAVTKGSQRGGEQVKDYFFTFSVYVSANIASILGIHKNGHQVRCPNF